MKKLILLPALFAFFLPAFSQAPFPTPGQVEQFSKSKTLVVLENNMLSLYNVFIKKAVESVWTITPYEFISYSDFIQKKSDPAYSFILLTSTAFERDKTGVYYNFINIILGDPVNNLSKMPEFCAFPISYKDADEELYGNRLSLILKFMQDHVRNIIEHPKVTALKNLKYYNDNIRELKEKILWVASEDLSDGVNTEAKIQALYDHPFKIVSRDDIDRAINNNEKDMVFLFKIGPEGTSKKGRVYKIIMGTDGTLYYFNFHLISSKRPDSILASDFKRIGRF